MIVDGQNKNVEDIVLSSPRLSCRKIWKLIVPITFTVTVVVQSGHPIKEMEVAAYVINGVQSMR